jgi:hypothetical protein
MSLIFLRNASFVSRKLKARESASLFTYILQCSGSFELYLCCNTSTYIRIIFIPEGTYNEVSIRPFAALLERFVSSQQDNFLFNVSFYDSSA